jgi:hypothetical protein
MENITIQNAKGKVIEAVWTEQNPNVYSEQIQARAMSGRNGKTRIDIRLWKDDNIGNYVGPTKAGFNIASDRWPKFKEALLECIKAADKYVKSISDEEE